MTVFSLYMQSKQFTYHAYNKYKCKMQCYIPGRVYSVLMNMFYNRHVYMIKL